MFFPVVYSLLFGSFSLNFVFHFDALFQGFLLAMPPTPTKEKYEIKKEDKNVSGN